jgi:hypothetical protein
MIYRKLRIALGDPIVVSAISLEDRRRRAAFPVETFFKHKGNHRFVSA